MGSDEVVLQYFPGPDVSNYSLVLKLAVEGIVGQDVARVLAIALKLNGKIGVGCLGGVDGLDVDQSVPWKTSIGIYHKEFELLIYDLD